MVIVKPVITAEELAAAGYQGYIDPLKTDLPSEKYLCTYSKFISDHHGKKYSLRFNFTEANYGESALAFLTAETFFRIGPIFVPFRVGAGEMSLTQVEDIFETMFSSLNCEYV